MENQALQFTVIKHGASGLVVRLKDGRVGLIRVRETSWSAEDRRRIHSDPQPSSCYHLVLSIPRPKE